MSISAGATSESNLLASFGWLPSVRVAVPAVDLQVMLLICRSCCQCAVNLLCCRSCMDQRLRQPRPCRGLRLHPPLQPCAQCDHDDRVVPLHSHKLTATLQHVLAGHEESPQRNPLITRIDVRAGHGAGKPTKKVIEEAADSFGFAAKVVGAKWVKE